MTKFLFFHQGKISWWIKRTSWEAVNSCCFLNCLAQPGLHRPTGTISGSTSENTRTHATAAIASHEPLVHLKDIDLTGHCLHRTDGEKRRRNPLWEKESQLPWEEATAPSPVGLQHRVGVSVASIEGCCGGTSGRSHNKVAQSNGSCCRKALLHSSQMCTKQRSQPPPR